MSCRGGVEDNVVEVRRIPGEQAYELIEGCNLGGAGARQLLPDRRTLIIGGRSLHLLEDANPVGLSRRFGVDIHGEKAGRRADRPGPVGKHGAQHLVEIGGGIRADQQNLVTAIRKRNGGRTGKGRLSDASLAREEQEAGRRSQRAKGNHARRHLF